MKKEIRRDGTYKPFPYWHSLIPGSFKTCIKKKNSQGIGIWGFDSEPKTRVPKLVNDREIKSDQQAANIIGSNYRVSSDSSETQPSEVRLQREF